MTRCIAETVYYEPGEIPLDASGKRIPKLSYIEETVIGETQEALWKLDGTFFPDRGNGLACGKQLYGFLWTDAPG